MDVEFNAVSQDPAAPVVGVNGQQLGSQRPITVQVVAIDEFGVLSEFRIPRLVLVGSGVRRPDRQDGGHERGDEGQESFGEPACGECSHALIPPSSHPSTQGDLRRKEFWFLES